VKINWCWMTIVDLGVNGEWRFPIGRGKTVADLLAKVQRASPSAGFDSLHVGSEALSECTGVEEIEGVVHAKSSRDAELAQMELDDLQEKERERVSEAEGVAAVQARRDKGLTARELQVLDACLTGRRTPSRHAAWLAHLRSPKRENKLWRMGVHRARWWALRLLVLERVGQLGRLLDVASDERRADWMQPRTPSVDFAGDIWGLQLFTKYADMVGGRQKSFCRAVRQS